MDTSSWNLLRTASRSAPLLLVMAACGSGSGGDGDSSGTDPSSPTDPTVAAESGGTAADAASDSTTSTVECIESLDCGDGEVCRDGSCETPCDPSPHGDCPQPVPCIDDSSCDDLELCEFGFCVTDSICGNPPLVGAPIELTFPGGAAEISALAFDSRLFVARGASVWRGRLGDITVVAEADSAVRAIALGDVDGDGLTDLLAATDSGDGEVRLWQGDGGAVFTITEFARPLGGDVVELGIGDREGDGVPDVYARSGSDIVVFPGTASAPLGPTELLVSGGVSGFAMAGPQAPGAFVYADGPVLVLADEAGVTELTLAENSISRIAVGGFTGEDSLDILAFGAAPSTSVTIYDTLGTPVITNAALDEAWDGFAVGHVDGDELADFAVSMVGSNAVTIRYGAALTTPGGPFYCETVIEVGMSAHHIALGDVTGDSLPDLVVSDGQRVDVYSIVFYGE